MDGVGHAKLMTTRLTTFARRSSTSRRNVSGFGFTPLELRQLRALKTPAGIQKFLDDLPYNLSYTARSPKKVLHDCTASCLEGGILAAAALRVIGFPPLIFDLEAEQDTDHVVAIFKLREHWGAVAKSNFTGCRYREPVYRSLRELAMSYFNIYFNLRGERTLHKLWIAEGTHLNVIGSNFLTKAEIDAVAVRCCNSIVVDSKDQARLEAGDFVQALEEGSIHWANIHELGQVIVGRYTGRAHPEDKTLFKSMGIAIEDVAVAARVYEKAKATGLGRLIEW